MTRLVAAAAMVVTAAFWATSAVGAEPATGAVVAVGAGGYVTELPPGAKGPQAEIYRVPELGGPMPTNDWWSSLAWMKFSERQYPHPLAVQAGERGLRVYVPKEVTANSTGVFGFMPDRTADDVILGHSAVDAFADARVERFGDWFVTARFGEAGRGMSVSYGHGSPFVYATLDGGEAQLTFVKEPAIWAGTEKASTLGVSVNGKPYGLFGPAGATWDGMGTKVLTCRAGGRNYVSVAALPAPSESVLGLFARYAHAHVTGTRVSWAYEPKFGAVTTTFRYETKAYEGAERGTLFALYPHQWRNTTAALLDPPLGYDSVRGRMKLAAGESFSTIMRFPGVLPALPLSDACDREKLAGMLRAAADGARASPNLSDTYSEGKWMGRLATLIPIAEQCGQAEVAERLRSLVRGRLERWLDPKGPGGGINAKGVFYYDRNWGTLIGYPASFGTDVELNDHHFHYGYFLKAAAEVARHDPSWMADDRWGAMIRLIARDIASADRADPMFPFLRNFDPYAGHTWASGHARFGDGNNNESSSEAMNAWCGLILLSEATGDTAMRDLGVWLYTTEMNAIQEYWFDVRGENRPATYTPSVVTMVWGGKGANGTWFSNRPPVVHGINFLPVHGGSLYLGLYPNYAKKNYDALVMENKGDQFREWADVIWMYRALSDPDDALRLFDAAGESYRGEGGNSRANTYAWITSLQGLGQPVAGVTADYPLSAVFDKVGVKTYAAWNISHTPLTVRFSDGFELRATGSGPVKGQR